MKPRIDMILMGAAALLMAILIAVSLSLSMPAASPKENTNNNYANYVTLGDYKNLNAEIQSDSVTVTESEIDDTYKRLLESYGWLYVEDEKGIVDENDMVELDYTVDDGREVLSVEGKIGAGELPEQFESAVMGLSVGETAVIDLTSGGGNKYFVTVAHVHMPQEPDDAYIESLDIEDIKTVEQLKGRIKDFLYEQKETEVRTAKREKLIELCYNSCTFEQMPQEMVDPFRDVLATRLNNTVFAYNESGQNVTVDDILKETYEKDNISTLDEYLDMYGLQNARIYAMCKKIADIEHISADEAKIYSLAAADWQQITARFPTFYDYVSGTDMSVYERSELTEEVKDYLLEISEQ